MTNIMSLNNIKALADRADPSGKVLPEPKSGSNGRFFNDVMEHFNVVLSRNNDVSCHYNDVMRHYNDVSCHFNVVMRHYNVVSRHFNVVLSHFNDFSSRINDVLSGNQALLRRIKALPDGSDDENGEMHDQQRQ